MIEGPLYLVPLAVLAFAVSALAAEPPGEKAPPAARPFDLADVRLLDGPAKAGQEADRKYLLALDPDRLLHVFRVNAGLPSSAQPLGGWEEPKGELRGHFVGHYLSACALMYRSTGDEALKARAEMLVAELAKCQKALGGKYLSAFPESFFDRVETTGKVWAPYYTIHKIMAGLLDVHQLCGSRQALDVLCAMAIYFKARTDKLPDEQVQKMLNVEFGGMTEVLFNLYAVTGNPDHLALARRFDHRRILDPLAARRDELKGTHVNTTIPKIIGAMRGFQILGDPRYGAIAAFFWDTVVGTRAYATGGTSNHEFWRTGPGQLAAELSDKTQECCCSYNMLKLTRLLFAQQPDARYADYYERVVFNSILGTQDPRNGMLMYYVPLASGYSKVFGGPNDSFWCCYGTGVESFAKLGDSIYFHDGRGIWVNLFIASEVKWAEKGITLRQETRFPEEQGTTLTVRAARPVGRMVLRIRIPSWARGATVKVGGKAVEVAAATAYCEISRTWADGDRVEVALPMGLRLERMPDDPKLAAVMYGPLVLAGQMGPAQDKNFKGPEHTLPSARANRGPALAVDEDEPSAWLEPVAGRALEFRTKGVGRPADVTLLPLYRTFDQRYAVYWKLISRAAQWPPAEKATLTIRADQPGPKVSPMLYGIFFEEINHAGDGGLYAELVRNRSFEDTDKTDPPATARAVPVPGWTLVTGGSRKGEIAVDTDRPMSEKNPRSLRLKIGGDGDGRVGVANPGFWGIAARKGAEYRLLLYARAGDGFKGPLTASLESADGAKVYAQAKIEGLSDKWQPFSAALTSSDTDPTARLVIAAASPGSAWAKPGSAEAKPGTVWLDVVSLFPKDTWKGRANGLRADLAKMLADLRPAFVRFPGGCWVEGDTLEFAQRWKRTIGDIADRWNQFNRWGYYSPNGLGYHEYLQMCEDLGAEPLFVINCGMSHKGNVPMDQLGEWVQDALDAIEYANGPADSKWGALRATAGHPAPFNLKYLEIGNENGGPAYEERYAKFREAVKAKYPDIRLVSDTRLKSSPMEIVDEHYYNSPEFFMAQAGRYDKYERTGPKIYVGEYAVTRGCGKGNLRGALGEAAFMTGMERNSDVVVMSSYAPLFVNVNDRKWNPDLIGFDSARAYGTPSYYVQKLFAENLPDVVLPVEVPALSPGGPPVPQPRGAVGVGTWATQAEFKDIKVMQGDSCLFQCDFSKGAEGWKTSRGRWEVKDGAFRQTTAETDVRAVAGNPAWTDLVYTLKARKLGGNEGFLIMFQVRDQGNYAWWNIGGWGNSKHCVEVETAGSKRPAGNDVRGSVETGRWYDIRIEIKGPVVRCFLDGKRIHEFTDAAALAPLYACAGRVEATGEVVLKVVNTSDAGQDTQINLPGVAKLEPKGAAVTLTSADAADENSVDEPTRVAPVSSAVEGVAPGFRYTFPPYSLTILRLKAGK